MSTPRPILFDLHVHSISSGHGSADTVTDLARAAAQAGLAALGVSEHAPGTPGACSLSYFRSVRLMERERFGVRLLYGAELNILTADGGVDLPEDILAGLDYAIVSFHPPTFSPLNRESNTDAMIAAMNHPRVRILGHPDDGRYPVDYSRLLREAMRNGVFPEINNASLAPDAYRQHGRENDRIILSVCRELGLPVLLSSDSHGKAHIGDMDFARELLRETGFPEELVLNYTEDGLQRVLSAAGRG